MAAQLSNPVFMGKYVLESTNTSGAQFYVTALQVSGYWVLAANATSTSDSTLWTAYDAGSGAVFLASENGMFVSVDNSDGAVILTANAGGAQALQFSSLPVSASSPVTATCTRSTPITGELFYTVGGLSPYLLFPLKGQSPPPGVLTNLKISLVTPALAAIQQTLNAAAYDLRHVDLTGASLSGVNCSGTQFQGATFQKTNFSGANLANAYFNATDIRGILWGNNIQAPGANFTAAIGCGIVVNSTGTPPNGPQARFDSAIFAGADFAGANLSNASFVSAVFYNANFSGAILTGANLSGISAGLSNSGNFQPADFSHAMLADADFNGAHLEGVSFAGAQMYYIARGSLNNAFLVETDLSGADLTSTPLNKTIVQGANFDGAILVGCIITSVTFVPSAEGQPVSMVGAHLEGAQFVGTTSFTGCRLSDASAAVSQGVPLFTSAIATDWISSLDSQTVPSDLVSAFSNFGYALSPSAEVTVVKAGGQWTLLQNPVNLSPGIVELVGFTLNASGPTLAVYGSSISVNEVQPGGYTINMILPVEPTSLTLSQLDPTTRCPNHRTVAVNSADQLTWASILTVPKPPLAELDAKQLPARAGLSV
jgi:uncharacterized protein YjbI with pentapeptide repeats